MGMPFPNRPRLAPRLVRPVVTAARGAVAPVASAALAAAAQTVPGLGWLAFVAFVPLGLALDPSRFWRTWGKLTLFYGCFLALSCYWICTVQEGFWVLLLVAVGYSVPFLALPAGILWAARWPGAAAGRLLLLPGAWAFAEILARRVFFGITWILVGQPLAEWPALAQGAALAGPEVLSLLAVATGVAVALCLRPCPRPCRIAALVQGPVFLLALGAWGLVRLPGEPAESPVLRAAVIQPNVESERKWDAAARADVLAHYRQLIDRTLPQNPDLLLLPETALAGYVRYDRALSTWAKDTVARTRLPLLFGTLDCSDDRREHANAVILITPYDKVFTYRKQRLLPFYEQIPWVGPFQGWLERLLGTSMSYTPGRERTLFELQQGINFGVMICYEDIFPDLARAYAAAGAHLLVTDGDTSAFGNSSQSRQHLRRAQLTAVAVGLPLVRCTNSGVSCAIDPYGRVREGIRGADGAETMVEGAEVFAVPLDGVVTPYRRFGDALPLAVLGTLLAGALAGPLAVAARPRRRKEFPRLLYPVHRTHA